MRISPDQDAIIDYFISFDTFGDNPEEGRQYATSEIGRFLATVQLIPELPPGSRVLELGSNPYFITLLLKDRFQYDLTCANYFGGQGSSGTQVITSKKYNETHKFTYDHFNVEKDWFPYPDHTYDVVLCCEIIEHLLEDPVHMLREIRRVLKPGGYLILTTPNVCRMSNIIKLSAGRNVYSTYSGHGPYGRHNREYTPHELSSLMRHCGFNDTVVMVRDIYRYPLIWKAMSGLPYFRGHLDHVFVRGRASGVSSDDYPDYLFSSKGVHTKVDN